MRWRWVVPWAALLVVVPAANGACTVTVSPLVETYNPSSGTSTDRSTTVTVTCTLLSGTGAYRVAANPGGGAFANRTMSNAGVHLPYQLYTDAAYTTVWGDGTGGTALVSGSSLVPSLGGTFSFTVWARTLAGANVPPGTFTDGITVMLNY